MFDQLISLLIIISIVLLISLLISYSEPKQEEDENDDDYKKRLNDYKCQYNGNRNFLCMGIVITGGLYIYNNLQKQYEVIGGLVEDMDESEEVLFNKSGGEDNIKSEVESSVSDVESYVSDNEM